MPFTDTAIAGFEGGAAAKAFASLPERWQLVLWHLEVENQKPAEIAPLLGMSANSVSALAYRAREGLRQAFLNMHTGNLADDDCRETHDLLGGYVRRGLARRDTLHVEEHLDHCRRCTATYLELEEVNSSLSALLGPAVLGGVSAAYLGGGGIAALSGGGSWASLFQLLDRSKDVVLASPAASVATASVVSMTTATAVVVGVQATPLALQNIGARPTIAASAERGGLSKAESAGFAALDKLREEMALGVPIPAAALPRVELTEIPQAVEEVTATEVLPEPPLEEAPAEEPVPDPGPVLEPVPEPAPEPRASSPSRNPCPSRSQPQPEPEPVPEPEPQPEPEPGTRPQPSRTGAPEPQPQPQPEPEPQPEPQPQPSPSQSPSRNHSPSRNRSRNLSPSRPSRSPSPSREPEPQPQPEPSATTTG